MIKVVAQSDEKFLKNSTIVINQWSGRFGNNLMQLSNAIFICLKYQCKLDFPQHKFLKPVSLDFSDGQPEHFYINRFYDPGDCRKVSPNLKERRFILLNYVRDMLTFDLDQQPLTEDKNRLVIQMRSGDIFNKPPNPRHLPSPMSYFRKIMKEYADQEVVIVCENFRNPGIKLLEREFENCRIQSSDLVSDIQAISNANNLIITPGTFGFIFAMLSKKIEKLYVDNLSKQLLDFSFYEKQDLGLDFEVLRYKINDYIKYGKWVNSKEQFDLIFSLPESKVEAIFESLEKNAIIDYYKTKIRSFHGEAGHHKLLEGLKKMIPISEDEKDQNILGIDVGANVGHYFARNFKYLCKNEDTNFLLFEPNPVNLPRLEGYIARQVDLNIKLFPCCVSDENGSMELFNGGSRTSNDEGNPLAGLRAKGEKICDTAVVRLDTVLDELEDDFIIKFLKIDTEGNDTKVIKGLGKYIEKTKYIIFEASDTLDDQRGPGIAHPLKDIVDYLDEYGFDTYRIGNEKMVPINGIYWDEIYEDEKFWSNCFSIRKGDQLIDVLLYKNLDYTF